MGLLKIIGKTIGTATLVVTGTTTTVLKGVSDAVGLEIGSELFGMAKDASFNGIRSMWSDNENLDKTISKAENADVHIQNTTRYEMARTAKQAAEIAKKNGDMEKYEYYMEKYQQYRD
jgi:hypothetical protein